MLIDPKKRAKYDRDRDYRESIPYSRARSYSESSSSSRPAEQDAYSSRYSNGGVFNEAFFASVFGRRGPKLKAPPIEYRLICTLEEMYSGTVKSIRLTRDVLVSSG